MKERELDIADTSTTRETPMMPGSRLKSFFSSAPKVHLSISFLCLSVCLDCLHLLVDLIELGNALDEKLLQENVQWITLTSKFKEDYDRKMFASHLHFVELLRLKKDFFEEKTKEASRAKHFRSNLILPAQTCDEIDVAVFDRRYKKYLSVEKKQGTQKPIVLNVVDGIMYHNESVVSADRDKMIRGMFSLPESHTPARQWRLAAIWATLKRLILPIPIHVAKFKYDRYLIEGNYHQVGSILYFFRFVIWERVMWKGLVPIIYILYTFIHSPLSEFIFSIFACEEIEGKNLLLIDPRLECHGDEYRMFFRIGILYTLAYVIAAPIAFFRTLQRWRKRFTAGANRFYFLFAAYSDFTSSQAYEVLLLFRKLSIVALAALNVSSSMQLELTLLLFFILSLYSSNFPPYQSRLIGFFEYWSVIVLFLTALMGFAFDPDFPNIISSDRSSFFKFFLFFLHGLLILCFAILLIYFSLPETSIIKWIKNFFT